jgi:hypothetical protein
VENFKMRPTTIWCQKAKKKAAKIEANNKQIEDDEVLARELQDEADNDDDDDEQPPPQALEPNSDEWNVAVHYWQK